MGKWGVVNQAELDELDDISMHLKVEWFVNIGETLRWMTGWCTVYLAVNVIVRWEENT